MAQYYDTLETRSQDERDADLAKALPNVVAHAQAHVEGYGTAFADLDADGVNDRAALAKLPVLRKSDLGVAQKAMPPLGGFGGRARYDHLFMSPGPIYEPGMRGRDWFRFGRAMYAAGIGAGDVLQNCFSYHLTPAGLMFENGAAAVGATVVPAGTGQTALQAQAARALGVTAYAGTPDYLKVILDKAADLGLTLSITKAIVGGGALYPSLRQEYADRGVHCLQGYGTADLGSIAYESDAMEGMIIDEGVIVEIVTPGTGDPVPEGHVGEVVVTTLNHDYPLLRFATGDLSAILPGISPCGRTNMRIKGWMGRADQTAKIKGMFVRPEQVADFVTGHPAVLRARVVVTRAEEADHMEVWVEAPEGTDTAPLERGVHDVLKLRGPVILYNPGSLPNDGKVIDDRRSLD